VASADLLEAARRLIAAHGRNVTLVRQALAAAVDPTKPFQGRTQATPTTVTVRMAVVASRVYHEGPTGRVLRRTHLGYILGNVTVPSPRDLIRDPDGDTVAYGIGEVRPYQSGSTALAYEMDLVRT